MGSYGYGYGDWNSTHLTGDDSEGNCHHDGVNWAVHFGSKVGNWLIIAILVEARLSFLLPRREVP